VDAAEGHFEAIDIENDEYEFCDDSGQRFAGELLASGRGFRIVQHGAPDPSLPLSFIDRTKHFWPKGTPFKTLDDARVYFSRAKT
jgi:hypothetical protein